LGDLNWRKLSPSSTTDFTYRSGIDLNLFAEGITYVRPATGTTFVGNVESAGNAQIQFTQGGLALAAQGGLVNQTLRLSATHGAFFGSATVNPTAVTLVIDANTGLFSGGFRLRDGVTVRDVRYEGYLTGLPGRDSSRSGSFRRSSNFARSLGLGPISAP